MQVLTSIGPPGAIYAVLASRSTASLRWRSLGSLADLGAEIRVRDGAGSVVDHGSRGSPRRSVALSSGRRDDLAAVNPEQGEEIKDSQRETYNPPGKRDLQAGNRHARVVGRQRLSITAD